MNELVPLSASKLGATELKYVEEAFSDNKIGYGVNISVFEDVLAKFVGCSNAVAVSSGTAAIHLALKVIGIQAGDEVLCSSFTFCASANPIKYENAIPVFVDSEMDTWNCDPELLEEAILDRIKKGTKPKAFILVHLYGMPSKMDEITTICERYGIILIEDAAEALGSSYKGKMIGSFGDISIFSFNANKIITTTGGGALLSNDIKVVEKARFLAAQARDKAPYYQHSEIGYNYKLSNVAAGIGRGQMGVLEDRLIMRRAINNFYINGLRGEQGISFLSEPSNTVSNHWLTCILFDDKNKKDNAYEKLAEQNIEARPLWKPMHLQPIFKNSPFYSNGNSEYLFEHGLCLPSGADLKNEDLLRVINTIKH